MAIKHGAALPFAVNDNVRTIKVYTPYDPELMTTSQIKQIEDTIVASHGSRSRRRSYRVRVVRG